MTKPRKPKPPRVRRFYAPAGGRSLREVAETLSSRVADLERAEVDRRLKEQEAEALRKKAAGEPLTRDEARFAQFHDQPIGLGSVPTPEQAEAQHVHGLGCLRGAALVFPSRAAYELARAAHWEVSPGAVWLLDGQLVIWYEGGLTKMSTDAALARQTKRLFGFFGEPLRESRDEFDPAKIPAYQRRLVYGEGDEPR